MNFNMYTSLYKLSDISSTAIQALSMCMCILFLSLKTVGVLHCSWICCLSPLLFWLVTDIAATLLLLLMKAGEWIISNHP